MRHTFKPHHRVVSSMHGQIGQAAIHDETMFFGCSPDWIEDACPDESPLTHSVIHLLRRSGEMEEAEKFCEEHGKFLVVDTRSHMLMPGMYPAIPGWHCDAYPRKGYNGQPDLKAAHPNTPHYAMHLSTHPDGVSRTEFTNVQLDTSIDEAHVWYDVDRQMNVGSSNNKQYRDGELVRFTQPTLHRVMPAEVKGWRWWFRMSAYYRPPPNEIRRQVQVYTTERGW